MLFAWELGGGAGHINHLLPLADGLVAAGLDVTLAMRDVVTTATIMGDRPYKLIQAPILTNVAAADILLNSWADLLRYSGYTGTDTIRLLLIAWLALFDRTHPDLIVAEFAPAATLAARIAGIRVISVGTGWTLPPPTAPLPSIQPWSDVSRDTLAEAEAFALGVLNAALAGLGARPLPSLAALFEGTNTYLCCFPELDHYAGRGPADYYGAIYQTERGVEAEWPVASGPRVFAYLSTGDTKPVIEALGSLGWPAVFHSPQPVSHAIPRNVWIASGPVRLDPVLADRCIVICQGLNLTSAALVAGCPVLSVPAHQEQMMLAHRVATRGLGLAAPSGADTASIAELLRRLHGHKEIEARAGAFLASYRGYRPAMAVHAIVSDAIDIVRRPGVDAAGLAT